MAKRKLSEDLRPASFRGVAFQVDVSALSAGRRVQVHEYPQRDKPWVEDLGRAARELSFTGFVVGDDYVAQANALLAALEESGPGTLIHPWFGEVKASLKDLARVSFDAALGRAGFELSFVEAGELAFPQPGSATGAAARIATGNLEAAIIASFADKFTVKGFQDFVTSAANGNLATTLGFIGDTNIGKYLGYANGIAASITACQALVNDPQSLGYKVLGMFGLSGLATTYAAWKSIAAGLSATTRNATLAPPSAPADVGYTPSRWQAYENAAAVNALNRQILIAQACGAASLVGTGADTTPRVSHEDLIAVRTGLITAIDQESLLCGDTVYAALQAARAAVWKDLTTRARDSARLTTINVPEVVPALVVAYYHYEDATRDADLVPRNRVRNPCFVPAGPLKVLTR